MVGFWDKLGVQQSKRPWLYVAAAFLISAVSLPWVMQLGLNSDFQALLPSSAQSVRDLDEIRERFGGTSTLTLAIEADDQTKLHAFVRALAAKLEVVQDHQISSVDWNVSDFIDFVTAHRHLYASLSDLREIRDSLQARVDYERLHANPFYLSLDDDEVPPDPEATVRRMEHQADDARGQMRRFPEGFYRTQSHCTAVDCSGYVARPVAIVFLRTSIRGGEVNATEALIRAVEDAAVSLVTSDEDSWGSIGRRTQPRGRECYQQDVGFRAADTQYGSLRIDYGGDLMDVSEETDALKEAVTKSTLITVGLIVIAIYIFFRSWRAMPLLIFVLIPPLLVAFALAEFAVDDLNVTSAFLGSIIAGNGVNSSIMWLGRYFEERRAGRAVELAIATTHRATWQGTLAAAATAAAAYGALMVTDYRGFRDFGFIGAAGLLLCWVAAYFFLPAMAALMDKRWPVQASADRAQEKGIYGVLFARLALSRPRALLVVTGLFTAFTVVLTIFAALSDPLEYDFRRLQSVRRAESRVQYVNDRVGDTVEETRSGSAMAILARDPEDVPRLRAQLVAYADAHPRVLGPTRTIADLMPGTPEEQREKQQVLADLRALLVEVRPHLNATQQAQIDAQMPPENVETVAVSQIPESVARVFVERDGTRGRLLFVEHHPERESWNGKYLIEWAQAVRSARSSDGSAPPVAGIGVVFADLFASLQADGPLVVGVAFALTLLLVMLSFRANRPRLLTVAALVVGVIWVTGLAWLYGMKLNFLNMVAFPVTFGIGVEYAVNVMKRYLEEKEIAAEGAVRRAVEGSGGAVILCSLTTIFGYISLFTSSNQALNSFGLAMALAEVTCLLVGVVVLPALLFTLEEKNAARHVRESSD